MPRRLILVATLAGALSSAGCAVNGQAPVESEPADKAWVTGSRIQQPVDPATGMPVTASPVYVLSREDIERTGETDIGDALRRLPFFR